MIWLIPLGFGLVIVYEIWAAITHRQPTISQWVWRGLGKFPQLGFLSGLGLGLLAGHLWLTGLLVILCQRSLSS